MKVFFTVPSLKTFRPISRPPVSNVKYLQNTSSVTIYPQDHTQHDPPPRSIHSAHQTSKEEDVQVSAPAPIVSWMSRTVPISVAPGLLGRTISKRPNGKWRQSRSATLQLLPHTISKGPCARAWPLFGQSPSAIPPCGLFHHLPSQKSPQYCSISSFCPSFFQMDNEPGLEYLLLPPNLAPEISQSKTLMNRDSHRRSDLDPNHNHGGPRPSPTSSQPSPRTPSESHGRPFEF